MPRTQWKRNDAFQGLMVRKPENFFKKITENSLKGSQRNSACHPWSHQTGESKEEFHHQAGIKNLEAFFELRVTGMSVAFSGF